MKYFLVIFLFYSFFCPAQINQSHFGKALKFDGIANYATIPNTVKSNFTLEVCIKTSKESAKGLLGYQGSGLLDGDSPGNKNDFSLSILNDGISFYDGASNMNIISKQKVTDGKWHHITLTRKSGGLFKLYIDGELEGENNAGKASLNQLPEIFLATNRNYMTYTPIILDEIRIWNRVLEIREIKNNLFAELPKNQIDLIAYYPISKENLKQSKTLYDQSGNDNHGTLINFNDKSNFNPSAIPLGKKAWKYPFYTSPTFFITLFFALLIFLYIFIKIRFKLLKRENLKLEAIVFERTKDLEDSLKEKDNLIIEKDVLLQEVHHRIKNNLQQISSLLEMQIQNVFEKEGISALKDAHRRISSMSLIHEMLYTFENVSLINTSNFIEDLISKHIKSFNYLGKKVLFKTELENHLLNPNDAISIGMFLSETISNSYKHAFDGIINPTITVVLKQIEQKQFVLKVSDNGIGLKDESELNSHKSFGMRLIGIFAKKLNGELLFSLDSKGFIVKLTFNIN